jgi:hypothetical protein
MLSNQLIKAETCQILCNITLKIDIRIIGAVKSLKSSNENQPKKKLIAVQSINQTWSSSLNRSQAATVADNSWSRDSRLPTLNQRNINQLEIRNFLFRPIRTSKTSQKGQCCGTGTETCQKVVTGNGIVFNYSSGTVKKLYHKRSHKHTVTKIV